MLFQVKLKDILKQPLRLKDFQLLNFKINFIKNNKRAAAEIYIKESKSSESIDELMEILSSPDVEFTNTPKAVMAYSEFVFQLGLIKRKPDKWQDMFFDNVHQYSGS